MEQDRLGGLLAQGATGTVDAPSDTNDAKMSFHLVHWLRSIWNPLWAVSTMGSLIVTIAAAVGFNAWCAQDDAITWPAIEASVQPQYPPYHALFGGSFAVALLAASTATVCLLLQLVPARKYGWALALWLGLSVGAVLTVGIRANALALPFVASTVFAFAVLANSKPVSDTAQDANRQAQVATATASG